MENKKRMIDANEFHEFLEIVRQAYLEEDTFSSDFAAEVIETVQDEYLTIIPTVDAVEVVRCMDCRKEGTEECPMVHRDPMFGNLFAENNPTDFCSRGERRSNAQ